MTSAVATAVAKHVDGPCGTGGSDPLLGRDGDETPFAGHALEHVGAAVVEFQP
jgi:hypothetical protein